jgi:hypothetical protein
MDITINNAHEEITVEQVQEMANRESQELNAKIESLTASLERQRENSHTAWERSRREINRLEKRLASERNALQVALDKAYEGLPSFEPSSPELKPLLLKAFRLGRMMGFASEVAQLAWSLGLSEDHDRLVEETSGYIHDEAEREQTIEREIETAFSQVHPLDPRAREVWRKAAVAAQQAGMCDAYEDVAERLGIPTDFEVAYEGYVEVHVSGTVSVAVSGHATRRELAVGDVEFLDNFDLRDYVEYLEYEVQSTDIDYEGVND